MPPWALQFQNFSTLHLLTVCGFGVLWALLAGVGRMVAGSVLESHWRSGLCVSLAVAWAVANGVQLAPGYFVAASNLPL